MVLVMLGVLATGAGAQTLHGQAPIVIGHRGASGHRPEHTLASYDLAIAMGADFIEPDLVPTRDGVLVARHEPNITGTTDVAQRPEFAGRRTTKLVDGAAETGWFAEDFTLAELRTLRAVERVPTRDQSYNGQFDVPTLDEILALRARRSAELGREVGVYIETKHPSHFQAMGLALEAPLVAALRAHGLDRADAPVFLQSFEVANLRQLRGMTAVRLVQLVDGRGRPHDFTLSKDGRSYADLATPAGLVEVRTYADAIGPAKGMALAGGAPTPLVADAHRAGLLVHPWTFRSDAPFLPERYGGDAEAEYRQFYALGVDGVFSDFPDQAVAARAATAPARAR